jgi:hypothetical protein
VTECMCARAVCVCLLSVDRNEAFVFKAAPEEYVVIRLFDFDYGKKGEPRDYTACDLFHFSCQPVRYQHYLSQTLPLLPCC